jgi:hypothetical protein
MRRKVLFCGFALFYVMGICASLLQAGYVYPLEVFTRNGSPYDKLDVSFEVIDMTDEYTNKAAFTFHNNSIVKSSITEIYFDTQMLLANIIEIVCSPGVLFSDNFTKPPVLPGGNTIGFKVTNSMLAGSDNPGPKNGVNSLQDPPEWVTITFELLAGREFPDVLAELADKNLNIGVHLTGIGDTSESLVYYVPEPASFCLVAVGLFFVKKRRI